VTRLVSEDATRRLHVVGVDTNGTAPRAGAGGPPRDEHERGG
jgi:hypothetical protein